MPKYFPLVRTKVKTVTVEVGDTGTVNSETLRYDLPEVVPVEVDSVSTVIPVSESEVAAIEQSVLAVLLPASEESPVPVEALTGTTTSFVLQDNEPTAIDANSIKAGVKENSIAGTDTDSSRLEVDVSFLWPNLLVSGTGFTETDNMLDKSNATFASCSSSSSGAVGSGGTEETTVCDFEVSVLDTELDDLTIDFVEISWEVSATSGIQTSAGQCIIDYQYSINNDTWVTFFAQTAQTGSTSSLVITEGIGGDWQLIKDIKFRAVGEVKSGTNVLSTTTSALWNYAKVRILASKDY